MSDTSFKESPSSKEDEEKKNKISKETTELTEMVEGENDHPGTEENQDEIFTSTAEEILKPVKSDISLLIVNENEGKLNEGVKVEVDENIKCNSGNDEEENIPPALPPRPPMRPRQPCACTCEIDDRDFQERNERALRERERKSKWKTGDQPYGCYLWFEVSLKKSIKMHGYPVMRVVEYQMPEPLATSSGVSRSCWANGLRKYVFLCTACGSLSILLGALFLIVYFMLKTYTSSLNHFETIPTYVPSGMLIATGFLIICLACRKNRNSFLMKLCGLCCLCCAVLCVSVTVTTTVIHMNRLQTLRECLYTLKTQSCTCYSVLMDNDRISDEGIKFVFNSTPDCEVIHGSLYSCLRAIFGLSVIGILVCIFSCMLVYQLLSHEKKKMYWAQLEMRCRYLYRQQRNPHYYSCCEECRYPPHPHELFPWDLMGNRIWSTGRIGNLYTPNPEDRGNHNRLRSGWNWRRLPWSRSGANSSEPARANLGSPDSQYGFSSTPTVDGTPYTVLDPRTSGGIPACHPGVPSSADITEGGFYSWGPPPPYASNRNSANNSPARRSLGDILQQVSPIRRNDNVSPARGLHHPHRHHMHHNRQCTSSSRQMPNSAQNSSDFPQKTTPLRGALITNAIQQHQHHGMDPLWSNSLSSVHRLQKVIQNKTNYDSLCGSENMLPANGFNTLPSLKKRNQPKASDIFRDETSPAYFFSSAENLGCSSDAKVETQSKNLPPRVFLNNSQPTTLRYQTSSPVSQNFSFKSQNDLNYLESSNQSENEGSSPTVENRPFRSVDHNTSLVKKLFVNCSPSKQKPRNAQESLAYLVDRGDGMLQTSRRKNNKKLDTKDIGVETNNENVITFHYRVGIPRSPDIQNFNQFLEKSPHNKTEPEVHGSELSKDKMSYSEFPQTENQMATKATKYMAKDIEMLHKHRSLIKEFNKNVDAQKKYRNNKIEPIKNNETDNESFNQTSQSTNKDIKQNFSSNLHSDLKDSPGFRYVSSDNGQTNESTANESSIIGFFVSNENESDVYFGDISNSSCYMSLQNDGLEPLMYEPAPEEKMNVSKFSNDGHPILNKHNLKTMENEHFGYHEMTQRHDDQSGNKHLENSPYNRHQDVMQQKHRNSRLGNHYQSPDVKPEENSLGSLKQDAKQPETWKKNSRRLVSSSPHFNETLDNRVKYFKHDLQDHYWRPDYHQESVTSNDEHSSGSVTADSGISTSRSFLPTCFDNPHREAGPKGSDERSEASNEKLFSFGGKISDLDFSHPLFQKPKVLPRGNKYKESDSLQKKKFDLEESESVNDGETDCQNKSKRNSMGKVKAAEMREEVSNQLLSTCSLTLTRDPDQFFEENRFENLCRKQDQTPVQVTLKKSPKPLPRTSVLSKSSENNGDHNFGKISRYLQEKEKLGHFIGPDAQYEFQDNFKDDPRARNSIKSQNLSKNKPVVPARPLNLQRDFKKGGKTDNSCIRVIRPEKESVCPVPKRRQIVSDENSELSEKEKTDVGSHSVNV